MPRPDERQFKVAMKKSVTVKPLPQQAAFAAQNLEDMVGYLYSLSLSFYYIQPISKAIIYRRIIYIDLM